MARTGSVKTALREVKRGLSRIAARESNVAFMFDFDGTILDTMEHHGNLAADVIHKHFGMDLAEAKQKYYSTTGIPFPKQLEKIFPGAPEEKIKACEREYVERKSGEVFEKGEPFPEIKEMLSKLTKRGHPLIISSSTEEKIMEHLLEKHGLKSFFDRVYGCESGSKRDHIKLINRDFNPKLILFTGDSPSDVQLGNYNVITVGKAGGHDKGMLSTRELMKSSADFATADLTKLASPGRSGGTLLLRYLKGLPENSRKVLMLLKRRGN